MALDIDLGIACAFYVITALIQIFITLMFINKFYGHHRDTRLSSLIRKTALLYAVSCCLRMVFLIIHYIGLAVHNVTYSSTIEKGDETYDLIISDWAGIGTDIFLLTSKIMLYWHLINRLKITYQNSAYYPSNRMLCTLTFFMFLIILITLILCIFFLVYIFDKLPVLTNNTASTIFLITVMATLMISDFIISSLIMYSFVHGLYKLIIDLKSTVQMDDVEVEELQSALIHDEEYMKAVADFDAEVELEAVEDTKIPKYKPSMSKNTVSRSSAGSRSSVQFIDMRKASAVLKQASTRMCTQQERLIETITKNSLLSSIAIGSTFIFLVFRIIILIVKENDVIALVYSILGCVDATLDLCVIYLNFSFAKRWYYRLCWNCDNWCLNRCRGLAERGIYAANEDKYIYGDDEVDNSYRAM